MSSDLLNPVSPRNPGQVSGEGSKVTEETQEEKYIEGAEYIPLPSKGAFYTQVGPQYTNMEKLRVRQLNYTDEDILTTKSYLEDGSVFIELLKNTIVDENGFPATGLMPVDRDTILLWLRSTAFGNIFEATTKCPACGLEQTVSWDLAAFQIPQFDEGIEEMLKATGGEYIIETPMKKLKVHITVPTIGRAREFEKQLDAKKKASKSKADLFGTGSVMLIVSGVEKADGTLIRRKSEIENYFKEIALPLVDFRYIRKAIDKINIKYNTAQDIVCKNPDCEHVQEGVEMPMLHPNFFWPDTGV